MQEAEFEERVERILALDQRYSRDAFTFLRQALEHTQKAAGREAKTGERRIIKGQKDVSTQELLAGIRDHALQQYGPMVTTVLEAWGVRSCHDFGELVFLMIEHGLLKKTDRDSRADFDAGYSFEEAFRRPFLPQTRLAAAVPDAGGESPQAGAGLKPSKSETGH